MPKKIFLKILSPRREKKRIVRTKSRGENRKHTVRKVTKINHMIILNLNGLSPSVVM